MPSTDRTTTTDEELVARFRRGDEAAFAAIHDRYRVPLVGFARRMLRGTGHDPEDVVQDAFLRAHAALRATDRPMALRAWLHMIVRNRALDHLRTVAARPAPLDDGAAAQARGADPAARAEAREELRRVVADIGRLPERQRLALVHRELGGEGHEELAARLGTTVQGTKSLLIRARSHLRASAVLADAA
jgi:RNA polymerase sigma factor (sigma-70 family)